jgi:pimeloyl-ACP methyl ester carboxylesterase
MRLRKGKRPPILHGLCQARESDFVRGFDLSQQYETEDLILLKLHSSLLALIVGFSMISEAAAAEPSCTPLDNETRVKTGDGCLAIRTAKGSGLSDSPKLAVFIHANSCGSKRPTRERRKYNWYMHDEVGLPFLELAEANGLTDLVVVSLLRPGYSDNDGNKSSGSHLGRCDNNTEKIVDSIAEGLRNLKSHYNSKKLVAVGHSDSGNIIGIILGKHPGIIDGAVTNGSTVNLRLWQSGWRRNKWKRSLSAHKFVDQVPMNAKIIAVQGENDRNVPKKVQKSWIDALAARGIDAKMVMVPKTNHRDTVVKPENFRAIFEALTTGGDGVSAADLNPHPVLDKDKKLHK